MQPLSPLLVGILCTQSSPATAPAELPRDWPPLPDFKTEVDYVGWMRAQVKLSASEDATALWAGICPSTDDTPEEAKAKGRLWGEDSEGKRDGMFTGTGVLPEFYPWDPADRPEWEKAYQATAELRKRIREIASKRGCRLVGHEPTASGWSLDGQGVLINHLVPNLAGMRWASKLMLESGWRAPDGKVDAEALTEAIKTTLHIAGHIEKAEPALIHWLVGVALRQLAYTSALHGLREGQLGQAHVDKMRAWLRSHDLPVSRMPLRGESAFTLDLMQYAFGPPPVDEGGEVKPNAERIGRLLESMGPMITVKETPDELLADMRGKDPHALVRELAYLFHRLDVIASTKPPLTALKESKALVESYKGDPNAHPLGRAMVRDPSTAILIPAKVECTRRATHLLYALHSAKAATGEWPGSLAELRDVPGLLKNDPFSGKAFIYRVENGEPLLYSVGMNGKDDGGKHHPSWGESEDGTAEPDTDFVFWPISRPGAA